MINKKPACIFTVAREEYEFAPMWYKYYSQFFEDADMFCVINDHSKPSGFEGTGVTIEYMDTPLDNGLHIALMRNVNAKLSQLQEIYEWVIFTETDEMIVPNPNVYKNFRDIFLHTENQRCTGYHLLHSPGENDYDSSIKVFDQRAFWSYDGMYNKTLLVKTPVQYVVPGFHQCSSEINPNPNIALVHMHYFDIKIMLAKLSRTRAFNWGNEGAERGYQNKNEGDYVLSILKERLNVKQKVPEEFKTSTFI